MLRGWVSSRGLWVGYRHTLLCSATIPKEAFRWGRDPFGTGSESLWCSPFYFSILFGSCRTPVLNEPCSRAVPSWCTAPSTPVPLQQQLWKAFLLTQADEPRSHPNFMLNQPSNYSETLLARTPLQKNQRVQTALVPRYQLLRNRCLYQAHFCRCNSARHHQLAVLNSSVCLWVATFHRHF